jgi:hypothetical protein
LGRHTPQNQHKNLQDRINCAKAFIERYNYQIPMMVDSMQDSFTYVYKAHPERFFVFSPQGKLLFKSFPVEALMRFEDLDAFLASHLKM